MQAKIVLAYLIVINIISFVYYGLDKQRAIARKRRISEHALLLLAGLGGSAGAWGAMLLFHHKTKHWKFILGVPAMFILHFILFIIYLCNVPFLIS